MRLRSVKEDNISRGRLKMFAGILLLLLYITGNVQVESFHAIFHSFEKTLHSQEEEKDPCHRTIYHDEREKGCEHKTHFSPVKKCVLCHVIPYNDQHVATVSSYTAIPSLETYHSAHYVLSLKPIVVTLSARAPPIG